jgi:hypothetical protein
MFDMTRDWGRGALSMDNWGSDSSWIKTTVKRGPACLAEPFSAYQ